MAKLTGTNPNQVPTNADLGTMAYQDAERPALGQTTVKSAGTALIVERTGDASNLQFKSDGQNVGHIYGFKNGSGGDLAFYPTNSSGSITQRMKIHSDGYVTMPYQPSVAGKGLYPRNSGNASYVQLNSNLYFDTLHHNIGSHFNNSTGVFTCPVGGMYFVFASFLIDDDSGVSELCRVGWFKNGTEVVRGYDNMRSIETAGRYDGMLTASTVIQCSANDTLTVKVTNGAIHSGGESHFNIHLLG